MHKTFPCRPLPFGGKRRYELQDIFELYLLMLQLYFQQEKQRIARCECCWQYFIPKTKKETHYCERSIDGLSCKKLGPILKARDNAEMDEALRLYDLLRHRMEERRNRYENAPPDQRKRLIPMSAKQYETWVTAAIPLRRRYLDGDISEREFLEGIDLFHELDSYEVGKRTQPAPNSTHWRGAIKGNLDFDPALMYRGFTRLDLSEEDPQWEYQTPEDQLNEARGGHESLRKKFLKKSEES